jgi:hypothetical protein
MLNMKQQASDRAERFTAACKPSDQSPIVVVPCKPMLTVTYAIDIVSAETLRIPYAVAINGRVLPMYAERSMNAPARRNDSPAMIVVPAFVGDTVLLYLNSDAAPAWRTRPVYSVTLKEHPATVRISEKMGLHHDRDTPVFRGHNAATGVDEYTASLTGNIWMDVSHVYQRDEVDERLPDGTRPEVVQAIKSIYDGLSARRLTIQGPARGTQPAYSLAVEFEDSDNPRKNIHHYQLLVDGLTRVHPGGYAALFNAAIDNGVDRIVVTSCWRPMLGSIAHRLGLGLDVNFVGGVRLNRQELKTGRATYQDADDNVSTEERILYREMKAAEEERRRAQKKAGAEAEKAKGGGNDSTKKVANAELKAAREKEVAAKKDWDAERNKHEPPKVRAFRSSLLSCACVGQLFDPWYMFDNTATAGSPNRQETANEITHAHHLHITVKDKKVFVP